MTGALAAAYSATGGAWQRGPGPIYDRLAEVVITGPPAPLVGRRVLDVGAGTGAATRAVLAAGASGVVAVDAAFGMLHHEADGRPPAAVGDALALPFADSAFDAAVAAFSLNHLTDPASGLREMVRVTRSGGVLLVAAYATDDTHPVKAAVEAALAARGWIPDPWFAALRNGATPLLATPEGCRETAHDAGLEVDLQSVRVPFPELDADDLIAWRLGMAQHAPFLARLSSDDRRRIGADAAARLGEAVPPLVRSIIVMRALRP